MLQTKDDVSRAHGAGSSRLVAWGSVVALTVAPVIDFWALNAALAVDARALAVIAIGVATVLCSLGWLLARAARDTWLGAGIACVAALCVLNWQLLGGLQAQPTYMTPAGHVLAAIVAILLTLLTIRFRRERLFRTMVAIVAGSALLGSLASAIAAPSPAPLSAAAPLPALRARGELPDIYLIIPDGYPGADVLKTVFGMDPEPFARRLRARGFYVDPDARASYSLTVGAIPAMLSMQHPITPPGRLDRSVQAALYGLARGRPPGVSALRRFGYSYVKVESGWTGMACAGAADMCVGDGWRDQTTFGLARRTPFSVLFARTLHRMEVGLTLTRFDELLRLARRREARPRFVVAHVMLPHAPMVLDARCRFRFKAHLTGMTLGGAPDDEMPSRIRGYAEQVSCVNARLLEVIDALPRDAIVVIAGDHGSDSLHQLPKPPGHWTPADEWERFSTFGAYRFPTGCRDVLERGMHNADVLRRVLGCIAEPRLAPLPPKRFILGQRVRLGRDPLRAPPGRVASPG